MTNYYANYGAFFTKYTPVSSTSTTTVSWADILKTLFPDTYDMEGEVFSALLGAIGAALDLYDPINISLTSEFSVAESSGDYLDDNGEDWAVIRKSDESDDDYRTRILKMLTVYINGPTDDGLAAVVDMFIGEVPIVIDYCKYGWQWGRSEFGDGESTFASKANRFTIEIKIKNPSSVSYNHYDLEYSLKQAKPARSRIVLHHNGTDTSILSESSAEVVTLV